MTFRRVLICFCLASIIGVAARGQEYVISTVAGGKPIQTPAPARSVHLGNPLAIASDSAGNIYFASLNGVFKVDPQGTLTRIAGNGRPGFSGDGGPATDAQLN